MFRAPPRPRPRTQLLGVALCAAAFLSSLGTPARGQAFTVQSLTDATSKLATAWADVDGDGDLDGVSGFNGGEKVYRNNSGTLSLDGTYAHGNQTYAVIPGDFDGDGDIDVFCVVDSAAAAHRLLVNDGTGSFTARTLTGTGSAGRGGASGDFDGDGDLDVVVTNSGSDHVLLLNDRFGTFAVRTLTGLASGAFNAAAGDYDRDGDVDFAVADGASNAEVFTNGGTGFFTAGGVGGTGQNASHVAWTDANGDGLLDVFYTGGNNSHALAENKGGGVWANHILTNEGQSSGIGAGDLDSDGAFDLFVGRGNTNAETVLYAANSSSFSFSSASVSGTGGTSVGAALGDYDGDGDLDVFYAMDGTNVDVLRNDVGTANSAPTAPSSGFSSSFQDFGGGSSSGTLTLRWDEASDATTPGGKLRYQVWAATGSLKSQVVVSTAMNASLGGSWWPYATRLSDGNPGFKVVIPKGVSVTWRVAAVDASQSRSAFSADQSASLVPPAPVTDLSIVSAVSTGLGASSMTVTLTWTSPGDSGTTGNITGGQFDLRWATGTAAEPIGASGYAAASGGQYRLVLATTTSPGARNWAVVPGLNAGAGHYFALTTVNSLGVVSSLSVAATAAAYASAIAGTPTTSFPNSAAAADYDADGDMDVIVGQSVSDQNDYIYRNDGTGRFTIVQRADGDNATSAAWVDIDDNGKLDAAMGNTVNIDLYVNSGGGNLSVVSTYTSPSPGVFSVGAGDADRDGDMDLLVNGSGGRVLLVNDGGVLSSRAVAGVGLTYGAAVWGDYDRDGDLDAFMSRAGDPQLFTNDGFGRFAVSTMTGWGAAETASWGDMDNDGDLDLVTFTNNSAIAVADNLNGTLVAPSAIAGSYHNPLYGGGLADLDNDGDLDIYAAASPSFWLKNNGSGLFTRVPLNGVAASNLAVGDFDGDRDLDFVAPQTAEDLLVTNQLVTSHNSPTPPVSGFSASFSEFGAASSSGILTLQWGAGADVETPAAGLRYWVRVGTSGAGSSDYLRVPSSYTLDSRSGGGSYLYSTYLGGGQRGLKIVAFKGDTVRWAVRSEDHEFLRSAESAEQTVSLVAPAPVTDLSAVSVVSTGLAASSLTVTLAWTAPGDDGQSGVIASGRFLVRWSTTGPISGEAEWAAAPYSMTIATSGVVPGSRHGTAVPFVAAGATSYFSVRTDDGSTLSAVSNVLVSTGVGRSVPNTYGFGSLMAVAWADYDLDGDLDFVSGHAVGVTPVLWLWRNDGADRFSQQALPVFFDSSYFPTWGDYDGDGDPDLLSHGANRLGKNDGTGNFTQVVLPSTQTAPDQSVWADMDNDGDLDLVRTYGSSFSPTLDEKLTIVRNDGGDSFVNVVVDSTGQGGPVSAGDFDKDGDLDLAMHGGYGRPIVLLTNHGNLHFTSAPVPGTTYGDAIVWADEDHDGDLDIVYGQRDGPTDIRVARNIGGGQFSDTQIADGGVRTALVPADFDDDGDLDFLGSGPRALFRRDGASYTRLVPQAQEPPTPFGLGWHVSVADYRGDGDLDALSGDGAGNFLIVENHSTTPNAAPQPPASGFTASFVEFSNESSSGTLTLTWDAGSDAVTPAVGLRYHLRAGTGAAGSSNVAHVPFARMGYTASHNLYARSDRLAGGVPGTKLVVQKGAVLRWAVTSEDEGFARSAESAEQVADLTAPAAVTDLRVAAVASTGPWATGASVTLAWTSPGADGTAGTLSGGLFEIRWSTTGPITTLADYATAPFSVTLPTTAAPGSRQGYTVSIATTLVNSYFALTTKDSVGVRSELSVGATAQGAAAAVGVQNSDTYGMVWADMDNDGDLDLLSYDITGCGFAQIFVNRRLPDGTFAATGHSGMQSCGQPLAVTDVDADGDMDVIISGSSSIQVVRNDGNLSFSNLQTYSTDSNGQRIAWGDFNHDGRLDAFRPNNFTNIVFMRNLDGVAFSSAAVLNAFTNAADAVAPGDFDRDGDLDVFVARIDSGGDFVLTNVSGSSFTRRAVAGGHTNNPVSVAAGDLDGDGDLDVMTVSQGAQKVRINDGNGNFTTQVIGAHNVNQIRSLALADFDNDGDLDAVMSVRSFGAVFLRNDGGNVFTILEPPHVAAGENDALSAGDFDDDGDVDLAMAFRAGGRETVFRNDFSGPRNSTPTAPSGGFLASFSEYSADSSSGVLTLAWGAGTDAETPAAALNYWVRIGSTAVAGSSTTLGIPRRMGTQSYGQGPRYSTTLSSSQRGMKIVVEKEGVYRWGVVSEDAGLLRSPESAEQTADLTPPFAVSNLAVAGDAALSTSSSAWVRATFTGSGETGGAGALGAGSYYDLRWGTSTLATLASYADAPFRSTVSAAGDLSAAKSLLLALAPGRTWHFRVTTVNSKGVRSPLSNAASVTPSALDVTAVPLGGGTLLQGVATGFLRLTMVASPEGAGTMFLPSLTLSKAGTLNDDEVGDLGLYLDTNANGVYDAGDGKVSLGAGVPSSSRTVLSFGGSGLSVDHTTRTYFVAMTPSLQALRTDGSTVSFHLDGAAFTVQGRSGGGGNPAAGVRGPDWPGLAFDGVDDAVSRPYDAGLDSPTSATLESWFRTTSGAAMLLLHRRDGTTGPQVFLGAPCGAGVPGFEFGAGARVCGDSAAHDGRWHHVAAVVDGGERRLFVDGLLVARSTAVGGLANASAAFYVGRNEAGALPFAGDVAEVRLANTARYATSFVPETRSSTAAGTLLAYSFDAADVDLGQARDGSASGRHGALTGGVWSVGRSSGTGVVDAADLLRADTADLIPAVVSRNDTGIPALRIRLWTTADFVTVSSVVLTRLGTAGPSSLGGVRLYLDDGDGQFGAGADSPVSASSFLSGANVTLDLAGFGTPQLVGPSTRTYFAAFDVQANAVIGETLGFSLASSAAFRVAGSVDAGDPGMSLTPSSVRDIKGAQALVTPEISTGTWVNTSSITFRGVFGVGNVSHYRYLWNRTAVSAVSGGDPLWSSGKATVTATTDADDWYFHVRGFDSGNNPGAQLDFGPYFVDRTTPTGSAFAAWSSSGGLMASSQAIDLTSGVTAQLQLQDLVAGLPVSTFALAASGDGHDWAEATNGFGVAYSTNAGQTWVDLATYTYKTVGMNEIHGLAVFKGRLFAVGAAAGQAAVFESPDGSSWSSVFQSGAEPRFVSAAVVQGRLHVGAGSTGRVYRSDTNGANFGLVFTDAGGGDVLALTDHLGAAVAAVGNTGRIYASVDGSSWPLKAAIGNVVQSLASHRGSLFIGRNGDRVYVSTTFGANFTEAAGGLAGVRDLSALMPFAGSIFTAYDDSGGGAGSYVSVLGDGWVNMPQTGQSRRALAAFGGRLWSGGQGNTSQAFITVFSPSAGWRRVPVPMPSNSPVKALASFGGKLYAGTDNGSLAELVPPRVALTGADGTTAVQTLTVSDLAFAQSTNAVVCSGVGGCGATNQLVAFVADRAGNLYESGARSVFSDALTARAVSTASYPADGQAVATQPNFSWDGPSTATVALIGPQARFVLQVAEDDPGFSAPLIVVTTPAVVAAAAHARADGAYVSTFTLSDGHTYHWRVALENPLTGARSPWSGARSFRTDFVGPTLSAYRAMSSTGGAFAETQWTGLASGVTVQATVSDSGVGLAVSSGALASAGDGKSGASRTRGFAVLHSTDAGRTWVMAGSSSAVRFEALATGIAAFAEFGPRVYATWGGWPNNIYRSSDGLSWGEPATTQNNGTTLGSMAVFQGSITATNGNGGVFTRSGDGQSFTDSGGLPSGLSVTPFRDRLFVADNTGAGGDGSVYVSTHATTWRRAYQGSGSQLSRLVEFNGGLYAFGAAGAHRRTFDGERWDDVSGGGLAGLSVEAAGTDGRRLYVASGSGVLSSVDGLSWTAEAVPSGTYQTLRYFAGSLYAGTQSPARFFRRDASGEWRELAAFPSQTGVTAMTPFAGRLLVGTSPGGQVWSLLPSSASMTGTDGTTAAQSLSARVDLAESTHAVSCAGAAPCAATNQIVFSASDLAGNPVLYGPFSVLVDTTPPATAVLTSLTAQAGALYATAAGTDALSGVASFEFQAATDAAFTAGVIGPASVGPASHTFTGVLSGTTYYVRVRARDAAGNAGAYSTELSTSSLGIVVWSSAPVTAAGAGQGAVTALARVAMNVAPGGANTVFSTLRVHKTGTAPDADIEAVELYLDSNTNGIFDADTLLGSAVPAAGVADVSLGANARTLTQTPETFFLAVRPRSVAAVGGTVRLEVQSAASVGVPFPFQAVGPFPTQSPLVPVTDGANVVTFTAADRSPGSVPPGTSNVPLILLTGQAEPNTTSIVGSLTLRLTGTLAENRITAVRVFRDANANAQLDGTDVLVSGGGDAFSGGYSTVTFTAGQSSRTVSDQPTRFFVAANVASNAEQGGAFQVSIESVTAISLQTTADTAAFAGAPFRSSTLTVISNNVVSAAFTDLSPDAYTQGESYAVARASLTVDVGIAQVNRLTVSRVGQAQDADVAAVKVWLDSSVDGGLLNESVDVLVGSAAFSGGAAVVNVTTVTMTPGTTYVLFVSYDVGAVAAPGGTLGGRLANAGSVQVVSGFTSLAGSFPFDTRASSIVAAVNTVHLEALDQSPGSLVQGSAVNSLLRLTARSSKNPVTWSALTVERTGTAADADVASLRVYRDADGDGTLSAAQDTLISNGADVFTGGASLISFLSPQTLLASRSTYFVSVAVSSQATPGLTLGVRLATTTALSLNTPNIVSSGAPSFPLTTSPVPVAQFPNTVTVSTAALAASLLADPGASNVGLARISLRTDVSNATFQRLRVDRSGTVADSDVAAVKLYQDLNNLGTFDSANIGLYLLVTSSTRTFGSGGQAGTVELGLLSANTLSPSTRTYFLVVDVATGAVPGRTLTARILDNTYVTVNAPNAVGPTSLSAPQLTVNTPPSSMYVVSSDSAPATALQGAANVPLMSLKVWMDRFSGTWNGLSVTRTGTASDSDLTRLRLFRDNGDGLFSVLNDAQVATAAFSGAAGAFAFPGETVTTSTQTYFLVTDLSGVAVTGRTFGLAVANPGAFTVALPHSVSSLGFPLATALTRIDPTVAALSFALQDRAPATLSQAATAQLMATLALNTTATNVLVSGLTLERLGTASDSDIARLTAYIDDGDGIFEPAVETRIIDQAAPFTSGVAVTAFSPAQTVGTAVTRIFLAVDMADFATAASTFGFRISAATAVAVNSPNYVPSGPFPAATSLSVVAKIPDAVTFTPTGLLTGGVIQSYSVPAVRLTAAASRDKSTWTSLRVLKLGSLSDASIRSLRVYRDSDASGDWGVSDLQIGSATVAGGVADVSLSSAQTVSRATATYFVVAEADINSTVGATLGFALQDSAAFTVLPPDAVSAPATPFQTALVPILDAKTPTAPTVTLPDGAANSSFETMRFVWTSTVALGSVTGAEYALGTTAGGTEVRGWTAMSAAPGALTISGLALVSGTSYYVSARATSNFGFTSPSGVSSAQLADFVVPGRSAPTATVGASSVLLTWPPAASGPSGLLGYLVEYRMADRLVWVNAKSGAQTGLLSAGGGVRTQALAASDLAQPPFLVTLPNGTVVLRLRAVSGAGVLGAVSDEIKLQVGPLPSSGISNVSAFPNPFDSRKRGVNVAYALSSAAEVTLDVFDIFGREVVRKTFAAGGAGGQQGVNLVTWDGADESGTKVSMGVYLLVIRSGGAKAVHKVGVIH